MNANDKVFQMVTDKIIAEMEKGIIPWQKPWTGGAQNYAISHTTGKQYSMLNQWLLGCRSGEWLTFNQVKAEGGSVKAGEKSSIIVFWQTSYTKTVKVTKTDEDGNEETELKKIAVRCPILKYFNVFHIDQCNGIKPRYSKPEGEQVKFDHDPIEDAENVVGLYFNREACTLNVTDSDQAFYRPSSDSVTVPMLSQYEITEEYYSTLFHEMVHSTGHRDRLNRDTLTKSAAFGSEVYSREELVAEMGAAFMIAKLGIDCEKAFRNSVAYLQSWIKALRNDKKMIVVAAGRAEDAVEYILNGKKETASN